MEINEKFKYLSPTFLEKVSNLNSLQLDLNLVLEFFDLDELNSLQGQQLISLNVLLILQTDQ